MQMLCAAGHASTMPVRWRQKPPFADPDRLLNGYETS